MTQVRKTVFVALTLVLLSVVSAEPGGGGVIVHPKPKPITPPGQQVALR